ncbi:MAG: hypothetical protein COB60_01660 [Flavobacteriaceae bacterium]|nr:MAG: hypothetical protein COB60_01660 [Flavobacteriaceae bacterium]
MDSYIEFVTSYPLISAMIQFALLGTLGDMIAKWLLKGQLFMPYSLVTLFLKMIEWAVLAICIKYAFVGFQGFVDGLLAHEMIPELGLFGRAFAVSVSMNLQFGLLLVILHRYLDNLVARENNWANIDKGMKSLVWFWIPAHTITFMLDKPYQIGLAAIWSVVLGVILGYFNRQEKVA